MHKTTGTFRVSTADKALIQAAAALTGRSFSDFAREASIAAANEVVQSVIPEDRPLESLSLEPVRNLRHWIDFKGVPESLSEDLKRALKAINAL